MKLASLFALVGLLALSASAQTWTNGTVMTFTNLLGRDYKSVTLSRSDAYGIVWSGDSGGGRIKYFELDGGLLRRWGFPENVAALSDRAIAAKAAYDRLLKTANSAVANKHRDDSSTQLMHQNAVYEAEQRRAAAQAEAERAMRMQAQAELAQRQAAAIGASTPSGFYASGSPEFVNNSAANFQAAQNTAAAADLQAGNMQAAANQASAAAAAATVQAQMSLDNLKSNAPLISAAQPVSQGTGSALLAAKAELDSALLAFQEAMNRAKARTL